jgi:Fe2+ transport system protein B
MTLHDFQSALQNKNRNVANDQRIGNVGASIAGQYETFDARPEASRSARSGNLGERAMSDPTREEIQAHISASEARTDTKIARLEGKIDLVISKLDSAKDDSRTIRNNQWVIFFGLALLIVAMITTFPIFFNVGTQIKAMVDNAVQMHFQSTSKPPN